MMKTIIYAITLLLSLLLSFSSFAEFKLTFNHKPPKQVSDENGVYTEHVDLNLQIKTQLANEEDYPGIGSDFSYEFSCQGDKPMWTNKDGIGISGPYSLLYLSFKNTKPLIWNKWPVGSKECTITWKGISTHISKNEHKILALSATDIEADIVYDRSPANLGFEQRNLSKPKKETFTMTKLDHHYIYDPKACKNTELKTNQTP